MTSLPGQIAAFILTLVLGLVTGTIFHFYQAVIRNARVSRNILYVLDFTLWIIIIVLVFLSMLFINQGEMRVYVLIALLLGILIYYGRISRHLDAAVIKAAAAVVNIGTVLFRGIKKIFSWTAIQLARLKPRPEDPTDPPVNSDQ